jgi:hypothetical protein
MASNTAPPAQAVIVRDGNAEQLELPAATFGRCWSSSLRASHGSATSAISNGSPWARSPRSLAPVQDRYDVHFVDSGAWTMTRTPGKSTRASTFG